MRGQRGQTAAEYVGVLLVVAALVAGLAGAGVGGTIGRAIDAQLCKIAGTCEPAEPSVPKEPLRPIAGMPDPPPLADGDGGAGGDYASEDARVRDRLKKQLAYRLADAAEAAGLPDAARHLRHYLGNTGDDLDVDPTRLLRDIAYFDDAAARTRLQLIQDLQARLRETYDGTTTYAYEDGTPWQSVPSDPAIEGRNWFYGLGGFSYSYTARATATPSPGGGPPTITIEYRLHVFDRYNWDKGKSVSIGGVTIDDDVLGDLHRRGLAREYEVRGTTDVETVTIGLNEQITVPPPADHADDREGERSDRGRDRGRGRGGR